VCGLQFFGDFFQLTPVFGNPLYESVLSLIEGDIRTSSMRDREVVAGTRLFRTVRKYELTEQHRSLDPIHTGWLERLRDTTHTNPITDEMLNAYSVLDKSDIITDQQVLARLLESEKTPVEHMSPEACACAAEALELEALRAREKLWTMASIAVPGNLQRHIFNKRKLVSYAEQTGQPLLCWYNNLRGSIGELLMEGRNAPALALVLEEQPELVSFFAVGAPAYLTCNVNPRKKLANGTPVKLHSLRFEAGEDEARCTDLLLQWANKSTPGEIIWVPVPEAVNVEVPGIFATTANANQRVDVATCVYNDPKNGPRLQQCIVVPIPLQHNLPTAGKKRYFEAELPRSRPTIAGYKASSKRKQVWKLSYEAHALTVAFAVTYHKLQAQTKSRLILDLNAQPRRLGRLGLRSAYVGWSRVRERAGLRMFPQIKGQPARNRNATTHLRAMKHDERLRLYLAGFAADGSQYEP
jgi:hypothetical protein